MKVRDLVGPQLDYWVAKGLGYDAEIISDESGSFVLRTGRFPDGGKFRGPFSPSTMHADGGPILEQEHISTVWGYVDESMDHLVKTWCGAKDEMFFSTQGADCPYGFGETLLIAGMRCFVASVYGEFVPGDAQ